MSSSENSTNEAASVTIPTQNVTIPTIGTIRYELTPSPPPESVDRESLGYESITTENVTDENQGQIQNQGASQ